MAQPTALSLSSQSHFPSAVSPGLVACCPTIDLSATVSNGDVVHIRRPSGEAVSKYTERSQSVQAISWKSDGKERRLATCLRDTSSNGRCSGQFLAIGWSDGVVRLVGLENSKAVHHLRVSKNESAGFTYIGWSRNLCTARSAHQTRSQQAKSWRVNDTDKQQLLDLPRELTFLEVETALPKLSTLPISGGSG